MSERCRIPWLIWLGGVGCKGSKIWPKSDEVSKTPSDLVGHSSFFQFSGTNSKCMKVGSTKGRYQQMFLWWNIGIYLLVKRNETARYNMVQPFDAQWKGKWKYNELQWKFPSNQWKSPIQMSLMKGKNWMDESCFHGGDHPRICTCFHGFVHQDRYPPVN